MRITLGQAGWFLFALGNVGLTAEARAQSSPYAPLSSPAQTAAATPPYVVPSIGGAYAPLTGPGQAARPAPAGMAGPAQGSSLPATTVPSAARQTSTQAAP